MKVLGRPTNHPVLHSSKEIIDYVLLIFYKLTQTILSCQQKKHICLKDLYPYDEDKLKVFKEKTKALT